MDRSWSREKSFYPFILCLILMLHMVSLVLEISFDKDSSIEERFSKPIVVQLKHEVRETKKQIVQSEDSKRKEIEDDAFLSDKTRSFDRQVRSKTVDSFKEAKAGGGKNKKGQKEVKLSDLGKEVGEDPFKKAAEDYKNQKNGSAQAQTEAQVSSTNDHLEEVPVGDITNLNTVEYKYYGFYHRIRQKLEQFWGRSLHEKAEEMASQGRRVPASEELITALQITLDSQGKIIEITILGSSGFQELDDAAIESFNEAGPFPNPPEDLIVDGKVTLEWGFVVKS